MSETNFQEKLNREVEEYQELEESINFASQAIIEAEKDLLIRQGRISILQEQIDSEEGFYGPSEPSVDTD